MLIKTVHGKKVKLHIPEGTQDGTVLRLTGMGIVGQRKSGDQYVTVRVRVHEPLTEEEEELLKRLASQNRKQR